MIFLLDTTVLIDALRAKRERRARLAALVEEGHMLATATVNVAEVYAGMRVEEQRPTEIFLHSLHCYPLTEAIARSAGMLKREWALRGRTLALPDAMIAATALVHDVPLITDNRKDFPMYELRFHSL